MSTRCMVGIGHLEDFKARYVHFDGYPTGVGQNFYKWMKFEGIAEVMNEVISHSWSSFRYYDRDGSQSIANDEDCYCHTFRDHDTHSSTHVEYGEEGKCGSDCVARMDPVGDPWGPEHLVDTWCEFLYLVGEDLVLRIYKLEAEPLHVADVSLAKDAPPPDFEAIEALIWPQDEE